MSNTCKFGLLSLGVAPRHCSLQWVSENRLIYCGLSDVCIVSNNSGDFVPEVILSIISYPNTFRSFRLVDNPLRTDENFEVISTTTDGTIVLANIFKTDGLWKYRIVYEDKITTNQMVDAFAFRNPNKKLVLAFATFSSIEIRFFNEDYSYVSSKMKALSSFLMVQCLCIQSLDQNFEEFLVIFGQTNKKLGLNHVRKPESEGVQWEAKFLDSKEAVFYLDSRISTFNTSKIELLAATECRVQIWSIEKTTPFEAEANAEFSGFNLESKTKLKFDDLNHYEAHLDSNILASQERICGAKWDYNMDIFSISTRENSIKVFALEKNDDSELWLLKASVCSYGEPALELCGVFDAQFSPSNSFFLAHNTVGGFYLFQVEQEDNKPIGFTQQPIYIGGHSGKVRSLCWANNGQVLLSVGADKTTRYFKKFENGFWAQKSRPQVHGHALRCVTSIGSQGFVSGAAEHMFRVFGSQVPQLSVQEAIERIQPLNLTPKPQGPSGDQKEHSKTDEIDDSKPTIEEYLQSGATAHEEIRKLYGHGNECYVTASCDAFVFTSAKGSRPDEAQMIVWSIGDWKVRKREIRHNSTITDMAVSKNGEFLVTVSRDRTLNLYKIDTSNPEVINHLQTVSGIFKRVIWTVAFHQDSQIFAAGTRDGQISVFKIEESQAKEIQRWKFGECISALDFGKNGSGEDTLLFATENGNLHKVPFNGKLDEEKVLKLERESGFSGGSLVYRIKFNPVENVFAICTETGVIKFISV